MFTVVVVTSAHALAHCHDNLTQGGNNINIDFYHLHECLRLAKTGDVSIYLLSFYSIESRTE